VGIIQDRTSDEDATLGLRGAGFRGWLFLGSPATF
jgi:hypothetical protein